MPGINSSFQRMATEGMMKPYGIRRIGGGSSVSPLLLFLLSLASLVRSTVALSMIEGAARNSMMAASTYSVAGSPESASSALQQRSRHKRSLVFPTGSDLSFNVGLSIPIAALSATSECLRDGFLMDSRSHSQRAPQYRRANH